METNPNPDLELVRAAIQRLLQDKEEMKEEEKRKRQLQPSSDDDDDGDDDHLLLSKLLSQVKSIPARCVTGLSLVHLDKLMTLAPRPMNNNRDPSQVSSAFLSKYVRTVSNGISSAEEVISQSWVVYIFYTEFVLKFEVSVESKKLRIREVTELSALLLK